MFQQVLVQGLRDLQSADERGCGYILSIVGNFGKLDLKVVNVGLKAIVLPHFDGEDVVIVLLSFLTGSVLSEECLGYLLEAVERMWRQEVKPIRSCASQAGRKGFHIRVSLRETDYHFILKVSDVLNWITHSGVVVEAQS